MSRDGSRMQGSRLPPPPPVVPGRSGKLIPGATKRSKPPHDAARDDVVGVVTPPLPLALHDLNFEPQTTERARLEALRKVVLERGCNAAERHVVWKLLLGVGHADAKRYIDLVERGESREDAAIRSDAARTFRSDEVFRQTVSDAQIARVLNALCHDIDSREGKEALITTNFGANRCAIGATLLYAMPSELEAFWCLNAVVVRHCPQYFTQTLHGAWLGAALAERCLEVVDATLHAKIAAVSDSAHDDAPPEATASAGGSEPPPKASRRASAFAELCAFPLLASFFACAPPLTEVVRLWDVLFALGLHLNVLLCVALVISLREDLLKANDRDLLLRLQPRRLPKLDAAKLSHIALGLVPQIPEELYDLVVDHPVRHIDRAAVETWKPKLHRPPVVSPPPATATATARTPPPSPGGRLPTPPTT